MAWALIFLAAATIETESSYQIARIELLRVTGSLDVAWEFAP